MVLISDDNQVAYQVLAAVSVPLRGLWFLSFNSKRSMAGHEKKCFRPLAGIMVLIFF